MCNKVDNDLLCQRLDLDQKIIFSLLSNLDFS